MNRTALQLAIVNDKIESAKVLLEFGADPHVKDQDLYTPLALAVAHSDCEMIELVFKFNHGRLDIRGPEGQTPLLISANMNNVENLKCLEDLGAEHGDLDDYNSTIVIRSSITGALDALMYLIPKLIKFTHNTNFLEHRGIEGKTALLFAASRGHPLCAEYLIESGADILAHDDYGENCLTLAAAHGNKDTLKTLLKFVDIEFRGYQNETALLSSAYANHHENMVFLLESGADISAVDNYGDSVLHKAARIGSLKMVKFVVEYGKGKRLEKNLPGYNKHTALALAAIERRKNIAKYLLKSGTCPTRACKSLDVADCKYLESLSAENLRARN